MWHYMARKAKLVDWIFQDPASIRKPQLSQLLGCVSLSQVLAKRAAVASAAPTDTSPAAATSPAGATIRSGGAHPTPRPFEVEAALVTLALTMLKKSKPTAQKQFADQVVRQLGRLAEVLAANESSGDAAEPTLGNAAGGATADLPAGTLERSASVKREREGEEEKEEGGYKLRRTGSSSQLARSTSVGGFGWRRRMDSKAAAEGDGNRPRPGPPAAVQVAIWMRLQVLLPLMPMVYSDRETEQKRNLRDMLISSLLQLLGSSAVRAPSGAGSTPEDASAAAGAGEPLFGRLLAVLHGLLGGQWAAWLARHSEGKRLREVPAYAHAGALATSMTSMRLPLHLTRRIRAALPIPPTTAIVAPRVSGGIRQDAPRASPSAPYPGKPPTQPPLALEPWQLLETTASEGGCSGGGAGPTRCALFLAGAVRLRRETLTYAANLSDSEGLVP